MRITQKDIPFKFILPCRYKIGDDYKLRILVGDDYKIYGNRYKFYRISCLTQRFGQNLVKFYKELGWDGHNGIDFIALRGSNLYSICGGRVTGYSDSWGALIIETDEFMVKGEKVKLQIVYGHLLDVRLKIGDKVVEGELLGHTNNKGKYTTGDHLHISVNPMYLNSRGRWYIDLGNGYAGAIDFIDLLPDTNIEFKQPMKHLKTLREIVDSYIKTGAVLGVSEKNYQKILQGDKILIDRIKKDHKGMFFRSEGGGQFYILE